MKFNKQKIDEIKDKFNNIKEKITSNEKAKVPKKYYALLILMLMLGIMTVSNNMRLYNESNKEEYKKYELEEKQASSDVVEIVKYQTAESSISTAISNMEQDETIETISSNNESSKKNQAEYIMPVDGEVMKEHAIEKLVYSETLGMWKTHPGIDIKAELGASVKSASDGTVQSVEQDSFYGNVVKILEDNGYIFVYSNLDNNITLKEGDKVKQGELVGTVGVSAIGELADASHLHFEIIKDETQVNPLDLIN